MGPMRPSTEADHQINELLNRYTIYIVQLYIYNYVCICAITLYTKHECLFDVCMYIYIYIHMYTYMCVYTSIYCFYLLQVALAIFNPNEFG